MELLMASFSADKWSNIKCAALLGNDNCAVVFSFNCWGWMIAFPVHGQSSSGSAHSGTKVTTEYESRIVFGLNMMFDVLSFLKHFLTH